VQRLLLSHPSAAEVLQPWLLPPVPIQLTDAPARVAAVDAGRRRRRAEQTKGLMPGYLSTLSLVLRRAAVFEALHASYLEASSHVTEATSPQPFDFVLPDGSATLHFQLWDAKSLAATAQLRAVNSIAALEGKIVAEFISASHGDITLQDPFFVEVGEAWVDPYVRARLVGRTGGRKADYVDFKSGFLRPPGPLLHLVRELAASRSSAGQRPRALFDIDALSTGMAYGALLYLIIVATGMRANEVQQIRAEASYMHATSEGITVGVYPKGCKWDRKHLVNHQLDPQIQPYWLRVLAVHERCWGPYCKVKMQAGDLLGLAPAVYLFQAGGKLLHVAQLGSLLRFATHNHGLTDDTGAPIVIQPHLLRHAYARSRRALGHDVRAIQAGLNHANQIMSREYIGDQEVGPLTAPTAATLWDALT
jgi:hypothetical protein